MPIYFALEGIVGSGKTTLLEWLKMMLLKDGYTFYMVPEPVDKFKKKVTYNPLEECYKCPTQSAVMAQIHIMDQSVKHYTEEVTKVRKMKLDLVLSEQSIVSQLIFTDTYFRHDIFSAFTKDSIDMMWGDETSNDAESSGCETRCNYIFKGPSECGEVVVEEGTGQFFAFLGGASILNLRKLWLIS